MLSKLRRPSAPMAVSIAALVVALGGTSYAASQIQTSDIAKNAVTSSKIADGTIKNADLNPNVRGLDGEDGATGPAGPPGGPGQDGQDGQDGDTGPAGVGRWALVETNNATLATTIVSQSGGFSLVAAYPTLPNTMTPPADNSQRANGNVYIDSGEDLSNNGILASIALQNTVDLDGDTVTSGRAAGSDTNPEFSGEVTVSRCNFPGATGIPTNCAPSGAQNATSFVVSPRNSDGSFTTDGNRKRFYVVITGDSSEYVPAP